MSLLENLKIPMMKLLLIHPSRHSRLWHCVQEAIPSLLCPPNNHASASLFGLPVTPLYQMPNPSMKQEEHRDPRQQIKGQTVHPDLASMV